MHRSVWCVYLMVSAVASHGYLSWPEARQYKCYRDNNFWWPQNGDDIPDAACRRAYKTVYAKYMSNGDSSGVAANAAQYMFQQYYEYAALAGADYLDDEHLKRDVVPHNLCAAGADKRSGVFGDKSGVDEPFADWRPTVFYLTDKDRYRSGKLITLHFCPTVVHEPSYFEVYVSAPHYNYTRPLHWDDLEFVGGEHSDLVENDGSDEACAHNYLYAITVTIPFRRNKFVIYVRWQRHDVVGEGFYNCADVVFDNNAAYKHIQWETADEL
ncbi:chitin bind 3 [Orgyia leucostigma nucleopolyhedrovirus]|uniref:Chitin bind 3 n=1 Tax=Orgyia leucostigma nucleopolyhedrovirus TaxID=490711 RepID=B0FDP7_9ABAC|nr:chitin bind 3 [Orgyia leucostigma nucleopolyhedrovirus]ABY65755.1 chitin bind 3 [Orgyia leucostigma nucleopolyhedrovirus]